MTKDELKLLVEDDPDGMGFWCAVILGEICEIVTAEINDQCDELVGFKLIKAKVQELDKLIIQRAVEKAKKRLTDAQDSSSYSGDQDKQQAEGISKSDS